MAASTEARDTPFYGGKSFYPEELVVKTGESLKQGCLCGLDSSGELVDATETTGVGPFFIASENIDSATAGQKTKVYQGIPGLVNGESLDATDIGATVYVDDNQTVKTTASGTSACGVLHHIGSADALCYVVLNGNA